jgi:phosphoenolpyruvate carboxylase
MPTWQQRVKDVDARDPGSIYRFLLQQFHEGIAAREQIGTGVIEKAEVLPEGLSADFMRKVGQFLRTSAEIRRTARTSGSSQPYADIASETVELFFGERVTVEESPQRGDDGSIHPGNVVEREVDFSDADRKAYLSLINMQYYLLDIATSVATRLNQAEAAHQEFSEKKAETMERTPKVHLGINGMNTEVCSSDFIKELHKVSDAIGNALGLEDKTPGRKAAPAPDLPDMLAGLWKAHVEQEPESATQKNETLVLYYAEQMYRMMPEFNKARKEKMREASATVTEEDWISFFSWYTGDSDGSKVPMETTKAFSDALRARITELYQADLLAVGYTLGNAPDVTRERAIIDRMIAQLGKMHTDPKNCDYVDSETMQPYPLAFKNDLSKVNHVPGVQDLIDKASIFGFHYLKIEMRENHHTVLGVLNDVITPEVVQNITGKKQRFAALEEKDQMSLLTELLVKPNSAFKNQFSKEERVLLGAETQRVLARLELAKERKDQMHIFTVADMESPVSALGALALLKGIGHPSGMGISLQYEGLAGAERAAGDVKQLLENVPFREHLRKREDKVVFAVGYSDITKRAGITGPFMLNAAMRDVSHECHVHGVTSRFCILNGHETGRGAGTVQNVASGLGVNMDSVKYALAGTNELRKLLLYPHAQQFLLDLYDVTVKGLSYRTVPLEEVEPLKKVQDSFLKNFYNHPSLSSLLESVVPLDFYKRLSGDKRPIARSDANMEKQHDGIRAMPWARGFLLAGLHPEAIGASSLADGNLKELNQFYKADPVFAKVMRDYAYSLARTDIQHSWRMLAEPRPDAETRQSLAAEFEAGKNTSPRAFLSWIDEDVRKGSEAVYQVIYGKEYTPLQHPDKPDRSGIPMQEMLQAFPTVLMETERREALTRVVNPMIVKTKSGASDDQLLSLLQVLIEGANTDMARRVPTIPTDQYLADKAKRQGQAVTQ